MGGANPPYPNRQTPKPNAKMKGGDKHLMTKSQFQLRVKYGFIPATAKLADYVMSRKRTKDNLRCDCCGKTVVRRLGRYGNVTKSTALRYIINNVTVCENCIGGVSWIRLAENGICSYRDTKNYNPKIPKKEPPSLPIIIPKRWEWRAGYDY